MTNGAKPGSRGSRRIFVGEVPEVKVPFQYVLRYEGTYASTREHDNCGKLQANTA